MLDKFKKLSKWKKILVGFLTLVVFPITLVVLSANLLLKGIKDKKVVKIVGGGVLTLLSLSFASAMYNPTNSVDDIASKAIQEENVQNEETAEVIDQESQNTSVLPSYKIALIDDANIGNAIRETIHIVVDGDYTLDQLYTIAEKEALIYTDKNKINALAIGFYEDEEHIGEGYDMGRVEYVPNGVWADAINVTAGDYSNFEFVNYLNEALEFPEGEDISSTNGETNIDVVKNDILNVEDSSIVDIIKEEDTLVINIQEQQDHPLGDAEENAIAAYTDWCLDNIKSDISKLDITVERPNSSVRALLGTSEMQTDNGRYFDSNYIIDNMQQY